MPSAVIRTVRDAIALNEHTQADMAEAAERAQWALQAHRAAHDELAASLDAPTTELGTQLSGQRMPAHPSEATRGVAAQTAVLRDAMAECRKALKQAEQIFATSRSRAADASSAVQGAVSAARKQRK